MKVFLIYPNQLFEDTSILKEYDKVLLIEEPLFFTQYVFHKQKLIFHRATMKMYEEFLHKKNISVTYIEHYKIKKTEDIKNFFPSNITHVGYYDLVDDWLEKKIKKVIRSLDVCVYDSPLFLLSARDIEAYPQKDGYTMNSFYIQMRKKFNILIDKDNKPVGGSWSFDKENRKKIPQNVVLPKIKIQKDTYFDKASTYVEKYFKSNYGKTELYMYAHTFGGAQKRLDLFLKERFSNFGIYEDAIMQDEHVLFHSVISPYLNVGLITPEFVVHKILSYAKQKNIPLNSVEGFIRQIIGWREFMRLMYRKKGITMRTANFFKHTKKLPKTFWTADTKITPVDKTISKVMQTAYCHHIERLMILSNYMLLSEYDPDQVYVWFMELFIDAYDWVMVPNVYGMGQYADGGIFATKPYISGSNYIHKMSDYKKDFWSDTWDDLYWNFIKKHAAYFSKNPRMKLIVTLAKKKS